MGSFWRAKTLPVLFILNSFFEVKSNPDNHFCARPSNWTTDYRFPRSDYTHSYFHLHRSACKSWKCHAVFSCVSTKSEPQIVVITKNQQQTEKLASVKSNSRDHLGETSMVFFILFICVCVCVEVTLEPGSSPNVHKVWKKNPLNNKVMHGVCKAKVLQMRQKFYLCTGYKILLLASTAHHKRTTNVLCWSSQCWHILKSPTDRAAYHNKSDSFGRVEANPNLRVISKCFPLESFRWDRSGLPRIRAKSALLSADLARIRANAGWTSSASQLGNH